MFRRLLFPLIPLACALGLAPLAVSTTQIGGDGPPYFPMARAIIGGLAFSTVVSLLVVPAFYAYFDTLSAWGRRVMRTARNPGSVAAALETSASSHRFIKG